MLKRFFDPKLAYRVVVYLRMSTDQQNKRSPEQQLEEITRRLKALGHRWTIVKTYRDEGKSGRYLRKRTGYQEMLRDIKTGALTVDLILVDTLERFGRVEELPSIRKELYEKHGVLVLTADTGFADPTTPQGKALGAFEAMRASEDGRIKAHNVFRGKRDAVQQRHWPGGSPPFGLMLQSVMKEVHGRQEVDYCKLVPNPETNWIVKLLLDKAYETGWGQTRLTKYLNAHPDIPDKFKPFQAPSIGYWLDNPIYSGEGVWAKNSTGIVDDTRVMERNAEEDIIRVPDFCPPTVPREQQEAIWAIRRARRERFVQAHTRAAHGHGKLIEPPAPGLTLKYLLTGLVRCGHCERAMNPASSPVYVTKAGEARRYTAYACPGAVFGVCPNSTRVPEEWLRGVVIDLVRQRLLPGSDQHTPEPDWLPPLLEDVQHELARMADHEADPRPAYEQELQNFREKQAGWSLSLANRDLAPALRAAIEADWEKSLHRQQEIERLLTEWQYRHQHLEEVLDPRQVLDCLRRLPEVLALQNPTRGNLELSLHIDRINCYHNGKVVLRTCKLGALTGAVELLADRTEDVLADTQLKRDQTRQATPRRRARLRVDGDAQVKAALDTAADPDRFVGLDQKWFWEDVFHIPEKTWPFQEMAVEAASLRLSGLTHEALAQHFGVTVPTIRKALRYAAGTEDRLRSLPRKMPRSRWHEDHALEVAAKKAEGLGTNDLVALFGKSDTTIRAALEHARTISPASPDDSAARSA